MRRFLKIGYIMYGLLPAATNSFLFGSSAKMRLIWVEWCHAGDETLHPPRARRWYCTVLRPSAPFHYSRLFIAAALCGILGYGNFFKSRWLDQILKWQMPQGCYGEGNLMAQMQSNSAAAEKSAQSSRLRDHRVKRQEKRMQGKWFISLHLGERALRRCQTHSTNLLEIWFFIRQCYSWFDWFNLLVPDGCSAHRTAVAAAALGTYVKFLVLYANGSVWSAEGKMRMFFDY